MNLQEFIDQQLVMIAKSLPETVKQPESFDCGWDTGYKKCLLDIERIFCEQKEVPFD